MLATVERSSGGGGRLVAHIKRRHSIGTPSLFDGKFVCRDGVVALAGVEDHGGEFALVRGVGIVLGFQAEGVAARIGDAALAGSFAVEKISGVKLDAGLGGENFQDAA